MKENSITDPFYLQLQREIDHIDTKASRYNTIFYSIRILLILLASSVTIISALKYFNCTNFPDNNGIIVWLGAITTALTAIDSLFQMDAKRNTYKMMLYDFRSLRSEYVHQHYQERVSEESKDQIFEKYKAIKALARDLLGSDVK